MILIFIKYKHGDKKSTGYYKHRIQHKHGEWISIDFYAYASQIRHLNPVFKVSFSVIILILCILLDTPYVSFVVIITMAYITIVEGGLPPREYLSILMLPVAFILISIFTITIDFSREAIGQYNFYLSFCYLFTSDEMIKKGVFLLLKVFAAISSLQMMALSTPSTEIIYVLKKAHMPKLIIELMNIIYRYIFILIDVSIKMSNSAKSRHGYCDFKTSLHTFGRIASNMLIISLKKANAYFDAMEARCYDGELIFFEEYENMERKIVITGAAFVIFLIFVWRVAK
jgi:cobalt/nickel transport system permease protein